MKKIVIAVLAITFGLFSASEISAHHAMEYIEMDSYSTAKASEFVFHLHYDYMVDDKNDPYADHWELTPGISYGIMDRLMFDFHCHFAKFGKSNLGEDYVEEHPSDPIVDSEAGMSPFIEALAFTLQFRVTDENQLPVDIAIAPFYEIPTKRAEEYLGSEPVYGGALILGRNFGMHNNITANFMYEREGSENSWGWALGTKFTLSLVDEHAPAFGVEIIGDFDGHLGIMPGLYVSINQNTVLKSGVFIGMSQYRNKEDDPDFMEDKEEDLRANITIMTRW
jgi:hypothetical protein